MGRATLLANLAEVLRSASHEPVETLLAEGDADGSLRQVANPNTVVFGVFGAITVVGLSAPGEGPSASTSPDATRISAAISELGLEGLATLGTRDGHDSCERS
ncbi:hypothetical protein [Pedococcus dokdonensis]|uniref:hypothetical protein n=1 Tax=Pedococcus dokdonensis TaxID=443156 RepID=UPI000B830747|nr:hypothetical protein [Pedococcus dokdonensis]